MTDQSSLDWLSQRAGLTGPMPPAPVDQVDEITQRVAQAMRGMVRAEVERLRVPAAPAPSAADKEIMDACRAVARASDALAQARYSPQETLARRKLEKVADTLGRAMRKHDRMPKGAGHD